MHKEQRTVFINPVQHFYVTNYVTVNHEKSWLTCSKQSEMHWSFLSIDRFDKTQQNKSLCMCTLFSIPCFLNVKRKVGLLDHLCVGVLNLPPPSQTPFQLFNQLTSFHETWYECYVTGGHPNTNTFTFPAISNSNIVNIEISASCSVSKGTSLLRIYRMQINSNSNS
jgi:hypothetical protein